MPEVLIRPMEDQDIYFIHSSWLRSSRNDSTINSKVPTGIWNNGKSPEIKEIISKSISLVAVLPEDSSHIVGFITYEMRGKVPVLHYLLIKRIYQGFGFSRVLLTAMAEHHDNKLTVLSHLSRDFVQKFFNRDKKNSLYVFNPYILKELGYGATDPCEAG